MRFRHALILVFVAVSLLLTAAVPVSAAPASPASPAEALGTSSLVASSTAASKTVDARARAEQAIVAMTSGGDRTGSALVVAPGLVVTSLHVMKLDRSGTTRIMTTDGGFIEFTQVAQDKTLGIVLLSAPGLEAQPIVWGKGRELVADQSVIALGIGSQGRERILEQKGVMKAPAAATGNNLMITDIQIDPLIEGGPLVGADGKVDGIVVSGAQKDIAGGEVGWAVPSEAVQEFVKAVQAKQAADAAKLATRWIMRLIAWGILVAIFAVMALFGWWFRRWYKAMEAREEAAMAAEEAARLTGGATPEE